MWSAKMRSGSPSFSIQVTCTARAQQQTAQSVLCGVAQAESSAGKEAFKGGLGGRTCRVLTRAGQDQGQTGAECCATPPPHARRGPCEHPTALTQTCRRTASKHALR